MTLRDEFEQWSTKWLPEWDAVEQVPYIYSLSMDRRWIQFLTEWHEDEGKLIEKRRGPEEIQLRYRFKQAKRALEILSFPSRDVRRYTEYAVPCLWSTLWNPRHKMSIASASAVTLLGVALTQRIRNEPK